MVYPSNGVNHKNGIKNEANIIEYLKKYPENDISKHLQEFSDSDIKNIEHKGGTKNKKDIEVIFENREKIGISIKNHKKKEGTFDWVNTTENVPTDLKDKIKDFKEKNIDKFTNIPIPKSTRYDLDKIFSDYLNNLTSEDITKILSKSYKTEENTNYIIVNDKSNKKLIMIHESNLDPYCNPNNKHEFILKSPRRAKTSRQIWIKSADGCEINTNLRIRLHLNNGINALLGKSKVNKTSYPCLKIQQDKVDNFLKNCTNKIIVKY